MANTTITNLPLAVSLNGTEQIPAVQSSATVRLTTAQIAAYTVSSAFSNLPAATTPLTGAEIVPLTQAGVTKRATVTQVTAAKANVAGDTFTGPIKNVTTISTEPAMQNPLTTRGLFTDNDLSNVAFQLDSKILNGATGTPLTSYTNFPTLAQNVWRYDNNAGFNYLANNQNGGRSGIFRDYGMLLQNGQGDLVGRSTYAELNSTRPGATHWLANPAVVISNATFGASVAGGYLQGDEYLYIDNGYATAVIDRVRNYYRNSNGTTLGQVWVHDRAQSSGTYPIDAFFSPSGTAKVGYDTTAADFGANKAAMALKTNDRLYFGASSTPDSSGAQWYATNLGSNYITYSSVSSSLNTVVGGVPLLQVYYNQIVVAGETFTTGNISIASGKSYQINGVPILSVSGTTPVIPALINAANDAAAATAGVPVNGLYRNGSVVMQRVT